MSKSTKDILLIKDLASFEKLVNRDHSPYNINMMVMPGTLEDKPMAKTNSCEAPHFQYHISGILRIKMDDGTTFDCKPRDVPYLPMGHDAWVIGKEPVVVIDFQGMIDYATSNPVGSKQ